MNQIELKKFGEFGALGNAFFWNGSSLPFGIVTDPPKNCRTDWSLKIFGEMGALDSESWEYPQKSA